MDFNYSSVIKSTRLCASRCFCQYDGVAGQVCYSRRRVPTLMHAKCFAYVIFQCFDEYRLNHFYMHDHIGRPCIYPLPELSRCHSRQVTTALRLLHRTAYSVQIAYEYKRNLIASKERWSAIVQLREIQLLLGETADNNNDAGCSIKWGKSYTTTLSLHSILWHVFLKSFRRTDIDIRSVSSRYVYLRCTLGRPTKLSTFQTTSLLKFWTSFLACRISSGRFWKNWSI